MRVSSGSINIHKEIVVFYFQHHKRKPPLPNVSEKTVIPEDIIAKCEEVHGKFYTYLHLLSPNTFDRNVYIVYICPTCGETITQLLKSHLRGCGCSVDNLKSAGRRRVSNRMSLEKVVELATKVHGDTYKYLRIADERRDTKGVMVPPEIVYICSRCGLERTQNVNIHLRGSGCICGKYKPKKKGKYYDNHHQ